MSHEFLLIGAKGIQIYCETCMLLFILKMMHFCNDMRLSEYAGCVCQKKPGRTL